MDIKKGIILEAEIGINKNEELALMLIIIDNDGWQSIHYYKGVEKIIEILKEMKGKSRTTNTINKLIHTRIKILNHQKSSEPTAISLSGPNWIYEDTEENYLKERI